MAKQKTRTKRAEKATTAKAVAAKSANTKHSKSTKGTEVAVDTTPAVAANLVDISSSETAPLVSASAVEAYPIERQGFFEPVGTKEATEPIITEDGVIYPTA